MVAIRHLKIGGNMIVKWLIVCLYVTVFPVVVFGQHGRTKKVGVASSKLQTQRNEDQFRGATLAARISAAAASCDSSDCVVVVPASESGSVNAGYPPTIPDNALIWDQRTGGMGTFIANPGNCKNSAGFLNIQVGNPIPAGQIGGVDTQCVGTYVVVKPSPAMDAWGSNSVTTCQPRRECWGYEVDLAPEPGTAQAVGFDSVAAGSGQAANMPAFRCLTTINTNPVGGWKNCIEVQGITDTAFLFLPKDTGLKIIQNVSSSESPQIITTSGNCTKLPFSQLYVGEILSVDSGSLQEDVRILNSGCDGNTTLTGIFRKSHSNPTVFTEYGARRLWDAQNYVTNEQSSYLWGSIQKYNESNTPNPLGFGVIDSEGTPRLAEFYTAKNVHTWRDVGTTGFSWQNQTGLSIASLSGRGMYSPRAFGTQDNCSVNAASPADCGSAASGAIVVPAKTGAYTVNTSAVTKSSRIFLAPVTDASDLPSDPICVAPATGPVLQSSRMSGRSFTFTLPPTNGTVCLNYWIVN